MSDLRIVLSVIQKEPLCGVMNCSFHNLVLSLYCDLWQEKIIPFSAFNFVEPSEATRFAIPPPFPWNVIE